MNQFLTYINEWVNIWIIDIYKYVFTLCKAKILYFLVTYYLILVIFFLTNVIVYLKTKKNDLLRAIGYYLFLNYFLLFIVFYQSDKSCEIYEKPSVHWSILDRIYPKVINDSDGVYFKYVPDRDGYTICMYCVGDTIVDDLQSIAEVTERFAVFEEYVMQYEKIDICFSEEDYNWNFLIGPETMGVLRNYKTYEKDKLLDGTKHWIVYFLEAPYTQNFEQLVTQYSFSAGVDNIRIEDPSDYRIMEEWDGLQYFSGRIYGSEEKAYEIDAFLKEKFPDAIISVKAYNLR